ncbi:unnamed protein product [Candida verbasci]|uniref:Sister chromatid cohesion protein DCC1 n=1 Tax=Candida verbasci TaxID=1227364 RepID=A0A9W4XND8_9ASCO|nr:unnamed protein product [Candida verbasci]
MNLYNQINNDKSYTYKLLQLPEELLENIENGNIDNLELKSNYESVVICNADKSWKVRQMNHSNTVLLMNKTGKNNLIGFQSAAYEYELNDNKPTISKTIPVYNNSNTSSISITELIQDSLCSPKEFESLFYDMNGVYIDGFAYILSNSIISELLYILITKLMSNQLTVFEISDIEDIITPPFKKSMLDTILHKFAKSVENRYELIDSNISKWFGIVELSKNNQPVLKNEFLLNWKSSLPAYYSPSLDLNDLKGYYCSFLTTHILYINPIDLSTNLAIRFKELFAFNRSWKYDEFVPFINDYVPVGKKVDSLIIKYGKKKKVGNEFIVSPG